ncbi:hypothetical protein [Ligilactobacillus equi]
MNRQLQEMIDDIDYTAQQMIQYGVLPGDYYNSSFSDMQTALAAKAPKDRPMDAGEFARSLI